MQSFLWVLLAISCIGVAYTAYNNYQKNKMFWRSVDAMMEKQDKEFLERFEKVLDASLPLLIEHFNQLKEKLSAKVKIPYDSEKTILRCNKCEHEKVEWYNDQPDDPCELCDGNYVRQYKK